VNNLGQVYVLCFDQPYKHAEHYVGWAKQWKKRIAHHERGTSGVRLIEAAVAAGITFEITKIFFNVDRHFERWLKNKGSAKQYCPRCIAKTKGVEWNALDWKQMSRKGPTESVLRRLLPHGLPEYLYAAECARPNRTPSNYGQTPGPVYLGDIASQLHP
jgi:hypothetical protein